MADARFDKPRAISAATAVPPRRVEQGEIKEFARRLFAGKFMPRGLPGGERGARGHLGPGVRLLRRARPLPVLAMSVALLRRLRSVREVN